ncbi:MAG: histone family protein nucleoid-structuring protein H-NS [Proteobacteria bacterium]|nr:MAG: histone family protein nucleoid-structuring protein H-NS [Pseudomonadota bacterium]
MANINLEELSFEELERLKGGINRTIEQKKQLELIQLRDKIDELIDASPFSLDEVLDARKMRKPVAVKYKSPDDPSLTWTGRGRRPRWVDDYVTAGGELEDLEV